MAPSREGGGAGSPAPASDRHAKGSPRRDATSADPETADRPRERSSRSPDGGRSGPGERPHVERAEHLSPETRRQRKQRLLTQGEAAVVQGIADALVAKDGPVFFLCRSDGQVPLEDGHGLGLYYHDCRFVCGYDLRLAGGQLETLASSAAIPAQCLILQTNPDIRLPGGGLIAKESLSITWQRRVDGPGRMLEDTLDVRNHGSVEFDCPVDLRFDAAFEDVFAIRGLFDERLGTLHEPAWDGDTLRFSYAGADGVDRSVDVTFDPPPEHHDGTALAIRLPLPARGRNRLTIRLRLDETARDDAPPPVVPHRGDRATGETAGDWLAGRATVSSESLLLRRIVDRGFEDLTALTTTIGGERFFAAGVPWFVTLFGRDSIITALEVLPYETRVAEDTLRLLARLQGTRVDRWRDEAPGKILHELRIGEYARTGEIPYTPYYGSVDSTPLFLVLLAEHARWTGSLDLFHELRDAAEAALGWLDSEHADTNGDGFVDYRSSSTRGLVNQGWKDSGDAIVTADGSLADPPIALVEVQGYAFLARRLMADLFERDGDHDRAARLRDEAERLRRAVERRFWDDDLGTYALALQRDDVPAAVVTSNPGHLLWTGLAGSDRAARTVARLLADDMASGWGIRTLSSDARAYNPIGYHLGTVWPHDNAIIATGFRRYGHDDAALRVFEGLVEAAMDFDGYRLPEAFAGFGRETLQIPVRYPVACHPQAWAAGAIPMVLAALLGLVPDGFERRLRIVRPILPGFVDLVELRGIRVGGLSADLRFRREGDRVRVDITRTDDGLDVQVEPTGRIGPEPGGADG